MVQKCQAKTEVFIFTKVFLHVIAVFLFTFKMWTYFTCNSFKMLDNSIPSETFLKIKHIAHEEKQCNTCATISQNIVFFVSDLPVWCHA